MPDSNSLVYYAARRSGEKNTGDERPSEEQMQQMLKRLSAEALKAKPARYEELDTVLQQGADKDESDEGGDDVDDQRGASSFIKTLKEQGYLRDQQNWLTKKGFLKIGMQILDDIMSSLSGSELGLHTTRVLGAGDTITDSTKVFEPGGDVKNISVSSTMLNGIRRILKTGKEISFPLRLEIDDFEEYETFRDTRSSIVYCIDLSSTMKYSLGQSTRIQAAKKALWSLYVLNTKFFPTDSVTIVGFASMASTVKPVDIPFLKTYDANDSFLHYTNYQAAFRLARKILSKDSTENKRIVMITDGQPSACYIDNEHQKQEIVSEKPYSNFYTPDDNLISKIEQERSMKLDTAPDRLVYLCYRHKKVDAKIDKRTTIEANRCRRDHIEIDSIVVSDETELLDYVKNLEHRLGGRTYHIADDDMTRVLVTDYLSKKVLKPTKAW